MNRAIKIILTGIIAGQSVFWCHRLAKATALEDGGAVLAIDLLCGYRLSDVEYFKVLDAVKAETGVTNPELVSDMMIKEGKSVVYRVENSPEGIPGYCRKARQFYRERHLFAE